MKNKFGSILLSVFIAFGLWLYVITAVSPGSSDTYTVPVVWENESVLNERGLMVIAKSTNNVTLKLSGNRSDLSKVNNGNITVKVDLSKIYEAGNKISLGYNPTFPGDVPSNAFVVESKLPGTITVSVAQRITKEVPVEVKWIGAAAEGFMTDRENRVLDYPIVAITGPDSVINNVEKAVIEVDLNGQRESISADYQYTLCNEAGEPVDAQLVTTNVEEIHLDVKIRRVKDIQLVCNVVDGGGATAENVDITLSTETIRVSGSEAALDLMGDTLIVGTIHLAEINQSTTIPYEILLPDGVTNLTGVNEVEATVQLKGLATKELVIEEIHSINVPEDMEADIITERLMLVVRGAATRVAGLTAEDITVSVDFANAEVGTSTYKANVEFSGEYAGLGTLRIDPISASIQPKEK